MSHPKAAGPSEARMVEARGAGRIKIASFRDTAGVIPGLRNNASFAGDTAPIPRKRRSNLRQNTHKLLMEGIFPRTDRIGVAAKIRHASALMVRKPCRATPGNKPERTGIGLATMEPQWGATSQNATVHADFDLQCRIAGEQDKRWTIACLPTSGRLASRWFRSSPRQNGRRFPPPSSRCPIRHLSLI